jgi:hypothetical protein
MRCALAGPRLRAAEDSGGGKQSVDLIGRNGVQLTEHDEGVTHDLNDLAADHAAISGATR